MPSSFAHSHIVHTSAYSELHSVTQCMRFSLDVKSAIMLPHAPSLNLDERKSYWSGIVMHIYEKLMKILDQNLKFRLYSGKTENVFYLIAN